MLSRLLAWWKRSGTDRVSRYGAPYVGNFEPHDSGIVGDVADPSGYNRFPPTAIIVLKNGDPIGSTTQIERRSNGWRFAFELDEPIIPEDILRDRISVFAVDNLGARSALTMLGAVQLEYLRSSDGAVAKRELSIDFSRGGNSQEYVRDGWAGPEPEHTWAIGTESTIVVTFANPGSRYGLEILQWPFVVPDKLPRQTLAISVAGVQIGMFHPTGGLQLLDFDIPPDLTRAGEVIIRLDHPDAARPWDLGVSQETRMLAIAVRRMRLKRYTDGADELRAPLSPA
jgi:hypothetical protein